MNHFLDTAWNEKACIRWLSLTGSESLTVANHMNYFSPHLVRVNSHPLVASKGLYLVRAMQRRQLYRYLAATEAIEIEMVNPALQFVMASEIAPRFVLDAYKVYTDEGFHALMCMDLRKNISNNEMPYLLRYKSFALSETLALTRKSNDDDANLILLVIACVNETMIASSLSQATDSSVFPALRELVMAHAKDEAVHNIYFTNLMVDFFPRLSVREQNLIAELTPDIFNSLHLSDIAGVERDLRAEGFSDSEIDSIIGETFDVEVDHDGMTRVCHSSMRMLNKCGLFDIKNAKSGFVENGLGYLFQ